jgi:hypothetical protein
MVTLSREELLALRARAEHAHQAPSHQGPLASDWSDKPHRVVYDQANAVVALVDEVLRLREKVERQRATMREAADTVEQYRDETRAERDALAARAEAGEGLEERLRLHVTADGVGWSEQIAADQGALARWEAARGL